MPQQIRENICVAGLCRDKQGDDWAEGGLGWDVSTLQFGAVHILSGGGWQRGTPHACELCHAVRGEEGANLRRCKTYQDIKVKM